MARPRRGPVRDAFTATGAGKPFDRVFMPTRVPAFAAKARVPHYRRVPKRKRPKRGWQ